MSSSGGRRSPLCLDESPDDVDVRAGSQAHRAVAANDDLVAIDPHEPEGRAVDADVDGYGPTRGVDVVLLDRGPPLIDEQLDEGHPGERTQRTIRKLTRHRNALSRRTSDPVNTVNETGSSRARRGRQLLLDEQDRPSGLPLRRERRD